VLAPLAVRGQDGRSFLQGQLSQDLDQLRPDTALLASCNSAQGRVQAVLTLIDRGEDGIWLLLPSSMLERTRLRLQKYVLRAKVQLEDLSGQWRIAALAELPAGVPPLRSPGAHVTVDGASFLRWHGAAEHYLVAAPAGDLTIGADANPWRLANIRAGLPQVYPETHEGYVAQMLNLDLLGGISFTKGCYTGQEIIARTHYRGTIKRRMQRFAANCPPPPPGTKLQSRGEPAGEVVDSAATQTGCELLAVVSLALAAQPLVLAAGDVPLAKLDLPYATEQPEQTSN